MSRRLIAFIGVFVFFAVSSVAFAARGGGTDQVRDRRGGPPLTVYLAHRPGLDLKLWVEPRRIVFTRTSSDVRCEGGSKEPGSIASRPWKRFPVRPNGEFSKSASEAYEGDGYYFMALSGRVHANRVIGEYRAWEERAGEEVFFPKCGTLAPRGLGIHFFAHRVSGPPWRPASRR